METDFGKGYIVGIADAVETIVKSIQGPEREKLLKLIKERISGC